MQLCLRYGLGPPLTKLGFSAPEWREGDLLAHDRRVHLAESQGPFVLLADAAIFNQVHMRYQRLAPVRNDHSAGAEFAAVLKAHQQLHDLRKPLVRADYDHAVDTWQWVLRLSCDASLALQVAALFHDIERLQSEPDRRVEQHATDYQAFKTAHAQNGATMMATALHPTGLRPEIASRAMQLVARHEHTSNDSELALLNDADALSFFALNSWGFFLYFGAEHTRKKVAYTIARMRPAAQALLTTMRLHSFVTECLRQP